MIGKIISGSSFSGTVGYVMKEKSRILEAEGIVPPDAKRMAEDFNDQTLLNPRLKNTVGHISLSFSPKDAPRMTDALMTQIAKEYMQKMGITDTQYLLVRHLVYDAIKRCLPRCAGWKGLEKQLEKQGIGVRYKYCGNTDRKQGVLFSKNGFEFSGSKIDRAFSFTKLDRHFTCLQQQTLHWAALLGNLSAAVGNYRSAFAALFGGMGGSTREEPAAPGPGGKLDTIPLPPAGSPGGVSAEQLQRKPGESPEEYIARITALLNAAAEAMAIAAMEHRRRLREQKNRPHVKL